MGREYDPVTLGILWDKLASMADEIYTSFCRTSFTPLVREAFDAIAALFDGQGRLLAQASFGPPSFIGTLPQTLHIFLKKFPKETWNPGDIIATNDPWLGTGHLNDLSMVRPVFHKDELVAFTGTVNHLPDVGGMLWSTMASEVYEEGFRLPPCRIVENGEPNEDVIDIIQNNIRIGDQVMGDIRSAITANHVGEALMIEFLEEYRIEDLDALTEAILNTSEEVMRERIRQIPNGIYTYQLYTEGIVEPIKIVCSVEVGDDEITVDFEGTSKAVDRGINVPLVYTTSYSRYAVKCVVSPTLPNNDGSIKPILVTAPEGCILNAPPPSPVAGRHVIGHFAPLAVWGALAKVVPDRVIADTGLITMVQFTGEDARGKRFSIPLFSMGGMGARPDDDGVDTMAVPTNVSNISYEVLEDFALGCLLTEKRELITDSGGPGRFRGGLGQEILIKNLSPKPIIISFMARNTEYPPKGYHGGLPGMKTETYINDEPVHPKGRFHLDPDSQVKIRIAGGGGFYDPHERAVSKVLDDVRQGYVSLEAAKKYYGVIVDPTTMEAHRVGC